MYFKRCDYLTLKIGLIEETSSPQISPSNVMETGETDDRARSDSSYILNADHIREHQDMWTDILTTARDVVEISSNKQPVRFSIDQSITSFLKAF